MPKIIEPKPTSHFYKRQLFFNEAYRKEVKKVMEVEEVEEVEEVRISFVGNFPY